ncbi:hypothetical protein T12_1451 [Trichinella patagoniensis]|uniref:Uncharacterized protein n=1 Tax=Trichinella patagoniensis TaxID=990121 RepID=A0A0V0ZKV6_9BILA|nr:hypothetical protein T12_1451 [Trichinella patagoniensis]
MNVLDEIQRNCSVTAGTVRHQRRLCKLLLIKSCHWNVVCFVGKAASCLCGIITLNSAQRRIQAVVVSSANLYFCLPANPLLASYFSIVFPPSCLRNCA